MLARAVREVTAWLIGAGVLGAILFGPGVALSYTMGWLK